METIRKTRSERLKVLRKVMLRSESDTPVMAWSKRNGRWLIEVSTAGWSTERLARYGLTYVGDAGFGSLYELVAVQN